MKSSLPLLALIIWSVGGHVVLAATATVECESAKEKSWKAKQVVLERQRAVQLVQSKTRLVYSQLVECRPGATFSAGRAQRCAHAQSDVPLQVQVQLDAEDKLHQALTDYQEKTEWVTQKCTHDEQMVDQHELLVRISKLEDEIETLKDLVEQFNEP